VLAPVAEEDDFMTAQDEMGASDDDEEVMMQHSRGTFGESNDGEDSIEEGEVLSEDGNGDKDGDEAVKEVSSALYGDAWEYDGIKDLEEGERGGE
jgi:hypothetical protein